MDCKLSSKQKIIAIIYTLLLVLILGLEYYNVNFSLISWIRFLTMFSLAIVSILSNKIDHLQRVSVVFILMVFGDFFLVLGNAIKAFDQNLVFLGFFPFALAYIVLSFIYLNSYRLSIKDVFIGLPFFILGIFLFININSFINGWIIKLAISVLLAALLIASWTSLLFLFKDTFSKKRSILLALSGILMLACDLGVGLDLFCPNFNQIRNSIPINLVWLFYLPGWALLAMASID